MTMPFEELYKKRGQFPLLLAASSLNTIHPDAFPYLSSEDIVKYKRRLEYIFIANYAQYKVDKAEKRLHLLPGYQADLKHCANLLSQLHEIENIKKGAETPLDLEIAASEKPLKFLGMRVINPWLTEKIKKFAGLKTANHKPKTQEGATSEEAIELLAQQEALPSYAKTDIANDCVAEINAKRHYYIWGDGVLKTALLLLQHQEVEKPLQVISPISSYMSWLLYFIRFGVNVSLLLKHTVGGSWMSENEKAISAWERFKTQWSQRKFVLLNDSIWATVNLITFFWLAGSGKLGYIGNLVTAKFLCMDLALTCWRYAEERTKHNSAIRDTENEITRLLQKKEKLKQKILELNKDSADSKTILIETIKEKISKADVALANPQLKHDISYFEEKKARLTKDLQEIEKNPSSISERAALEIEKIRLNISQLEVGIEQQHKLKEQTEFAWNYKYRSLAVDLVAVTGTVIGYSMVCCFFFPPGIIVPATAIMIALAGAALCFVITVSSSSLNASFAVSKAKKTKEIINQEREKLSSAFSDALRKNDENLQKKIFWEMKGLDNQSFQQQQQINYQIKKLLRTVFVDALLPGLVILAIVFTPAAIAISVAAASFLLAVATWWPLKDGPTPPPDLQKQIPPEDEFKIFKENFVNKQLVKEEKFSHKSRGLGFLDSPPQGYKAMNDQSSSEEGPTTGNSAA